MVEATSQSNLPPLVFNVFKPVNITSYDVVRHFKRNLPRGYGKIGHFGTLDPFASGVLMIGVAGATRINNYVHDMLPKTYLAVGKLGVHTETGDLTIPVQKQDDSKYFKEKIASFSKEFIEETLQEKFLGNYLQAPHQYSAAKFQGKPLHKWAREGVEIKKEPVMREIYSLEVVSFKFPYLSLRVSVSSGTYIRTLFKDCAEYLGTYGTLAALSREAIGGVSIKSSLRKAIWPKRDEEWDMREHGLLIDQVLPLKKITLESEVATRYANGIPADNMIAEDFGKCWIYDQQGALLGMGESKAGQIVSVFNLPSPIDVSL